MHVSCNTIQGAGCCEGKGLPFVSNETKHRRPTQFESLKLVGLKDGGEEMPRRIHIRQPRKNIFQQRIFSGNNLCGSRSRGSPGYPQSRDQCGCATRERERGEMSASTPSRGPGMVVLPYSGRAAESAEGEGGVKVPGTKS